MANVSFEYFPARSDMTNNLLQETVAVLAAYQPEFQSVTFGAGGSQTSATMATVQSLSHNSAIPTACHLTYSGQDRAQVESFANSLWEAGFKKLVALRGDAECQSGAGPAFRNTAEFVRSLLDRHPFDITVACYPETHPLCASPQADLEVLKAKQQAGATAAITQFFFDNSVFYRFVERARDFGITIPIIPGILPIHDFGRVREMAGKCGTAIPEFVHRAFSNAGTSGSNELEIAAELLKAQVHDLACAGFETIHIYTLNRAPLADMAANTFLKAHREFVENRNEKSA